MNTFRSVERSDPAYTPEGLHFITVKSAALRRRADVLLWVPPSLGAGGAQPPRSLPLVLLLHGVYGSHWAWAFKGGAHHTAQRLIEAGEIPPLALALPSDGLGGDGAGYVAHADEDSEAWIADEVPTLCRQAGLGVDTGSPLCIAGLSMGGFGALRLAGKHAHRFVAAAAHSAVTEAAQLDPLLAEPRSGWSALPADLSVLAALRQGAGALPALRFDCGLDDGLLPANRALHTALQAEGIAHQYAEHPGGHDWAYWSQHLADTLRFFGAALRAPATPPGGA